MKARKENTEHVPDTEKTQDLGQESMGNLTSDNENLANDLKYDDEENSYELDVESSTKDYNHPDPYDTAAKDGEDMDSDWDEANLDISNEYDQDPSLETEMEKEGMHIDEGQSIELDPRDEKLAETPEDQRTDLDEEGYPKNNGEKMP